MNIDWSKAPEGYPIWIEDLQPEEFADGSGWHRDDGDRYTDADGLFWRKPAANYYIAHELPALITALHDNGDLIAAKATIAQQAQMIEHLRGGPTPLYTAVDVTNADVRGRRSLAEHLIKQIAIEHPDQDTLLTVGHIAQWIALEAGL